jgi:hypothetical protein
MGFSVIEGLPSRIVGLREPGSAWALSAKVVFHAVRSNHVEGKRSHDFVMAGITTDEVKGIVSGSAQILTIVPQS